jgi:3-hydroxyacyl-CoA dehydrogenase
VRDAAYPRMAVAGANEAARRLVQQGRLGRASGRGWYLYDKNSRKPRPDPEIEAQFAGKPPRVDAAEGARMMLCVAACEGARLLAEGVAQRESDLDVTSVLGFGFPGQYGGLLRWARCVEGWPVILANLARWRAAFDLPMFDAPPSVPK